MKRLERNRAHVRCPDVAINLNPYQGLKHHLQVAHLYRIRVAINLNPYQGLKHEVALLTQGVVVKLQST